MYLGGSKKVAIVVVALIIVVAIDGFLAYRYYDRLANTRSASVDTVPSGDATERTESAFEQAEITGDTVDDTTVESRKENESSFVHQADPQNIFDNSTYVDNPRTNGTPDAVLLVKSSKSGDTDDYAHSIGVWYAAGIERWAIFNQDIVPMQEGAAFEVIIAEESSGGSGAAGGYHSVFVHQATTANIVGSVTYIDDPSVNGNPDAALSITPNWNPGGRGGTYDDHPVGVSYDPDSESWMILNEDNAQMPDGAAFNVAVSQDTSAKR